MKVLLAVDGSPYTRKMLDYLAQHADLLGTNNEYTVLYVEPILPPRARGALGKETVDRYHSEEAQKVLDPVIASLRATGREATVMCEVGQPGETIARVASAGGYGLLVMGSHGHGALLRMVMGSVTTSVLAHCDVPVLLVR